MEITSAVASGGKNVVEERGQGFQDPRSQVKNLKKSFLSKLTTWTLEPSNP